MADRSEMMK